MLFVDYAICLVLYHIKTMESLVMMIKIIIIMMIKIVIIMMIKIIIIFVETFHSNSI